MLSYMESVCDRMRASSPGAQTERRGDAGPVRDLLGGKAAPADFIHGGDKSRRSYTLRQVGHLAAVAGTQRLKQRQRRAVAQKLHRAVRKREVGAMHVAATECA